MIALNLLEKCLDIFAHNSEAVLCFGGTQLIDEHGRITASYMDNPDLQMNQVSERLRRFHEKAGLTNVSYGLMRANVMPHRSLFIDGSLPATDVRFIAELTPQRKSIEIPEVLFYRRMHSGATSDKRNDIARQRELWSAGASQVRLPALRLNLKFFRSALSADIILHETTRLRGYICRRMIWQKETIVREFFHLLRRA